MVRQIVLRERDTGKESRALQNIGDSIRIVDPTTNTEIMNLEAHASRHAANGPDPLPANSISRDMLQQNAVFVRALAMQLEAKSGLAADSVGVKATSPRFTFSAQGVKAIRLRSQITAIPTDATVRVGVYDVTTGTWVIYRDYSGATGEYEDVVTAGFPADGNVLEIRVEVVTASATAGATFDVGYVSVMVDYGFS